MKNEELLYKLWKKHYPDVVVDTNFINNVISPIITKLTRIVYLEGITYYSIWADHILDGNELCDEYEEELKSLKETL